MNPKAPTTVSEYFDNLTYLNFRHSSSSLASSPLDLLKPPKESVAAAIERQTPNLMWTTSSTGTYHYGGPAGSTQSPYHPRHEQLAACAHCGLINRLPSAESGAPPKPVDAPQRRRSTDSNGSCSKNKKKKTQKVRFDFSFFTHFYAAFGQLNHMFSVLLLILSRWCCSLQPDFFVATDVSSPFFLRPNLLRPLLRFSTIFSDRRHWVNWRCSPLLLLRIFDDSKQWSKEQGVRSKYGARRFQAQSRPLMNEYMNGIRRGSCVANE